MTTGDIIKVLRKRAGMTQAELAQRLGYTSPSTITKIELNQIELTQPKIKAIADLFGVSPSYLVFGDEESAPEYYTDNTVMIPLYGDVAAGLPIYANPDVQGHFAISSDLAIRGKHFALSIRGDSMEPKFYNGDIIVVREQPFVEFGQIGVVQIDGESATCKKVKQTAAGLELHPLNPNHDVQFYTKKEVRDRNISVLGLVVAVYHVLEN